MNNRTISLVQDIESLISASPEHAREIIKMLNALLETRTMEHYLGNSEVIIAMLEEWLNRKANIPENSVITVDVDFKALKNIASEFEPLTEPEAGNVAEYLSAVFRKHNDLLQIFLSDKLGIPAKQRSPKNVEDWRLKLWFTMNSFQNCNYAEDFFMEIPKTLSDEAVSSHVREYYESRGYKVSPINEYGVMVKNDKEMFCVVLTRSDILQVTVHSSITA